MKYDITTTNDSLCTDVKLELATACSICLFKTVFDLSSIKFGQTLTQDDCSLLGALDLMNLRSLAFGRQKWNLKLRLEKSKWLLKTGGLQVVNIPMVQKNHYILVKNFKEIYSDYKILVKLQLWILIGLSK